MTTSLESPRIALGSDHAGFQLKERLKTYLQNAGYRVDDMGTWSQEPVDYPDFAAKVALSVADQTHDLGLLACGTGIGMSIAANKIRGIRAALAQDPSSARLACEHNHANVLTLGARVIAEPQAIEIVKAFLEASFAGGRHQRRIDKISLLEEGQE